MKKEKHYIGKPYAGWVDVKIDDFPTFTPGYGGDFPFNILDNIYRSLIFNIPFSLQLYEDDLESTSCITLFCSGSPFEVNKKGAFEINKSATLFLIVYHCYDGVYVIEDIYKDKINYEELFSTIVNDIELYIEDWCKDWYTSSKDRQKLLKDRLSMTKKFFESMKKQYEVKE